MMHTRISSLADFILGVNIDLNSGWNYLLWSTVIINFSFIAAILNSHAYCRALGGDDTLLCQFMPLTDHQVEANVAVLLHLHSVSSYKRINIRAEEMSIKEATYLFIAKTNRQFPHIQENRWPIFQSWRTCVCGGGEISWKVLCWKIFSMVLFFL